MTLSDWLNNDWIVKHEPSKREIADLLGVADRDLADAQVPGLSADGKFRFAYNAVLQIATAALAAEGYRSAREAHHYRTLQSLAFTMKTEESLIILIDESRKKRNIAGYERSGTVSDSEVEEVTALAIGLRKDFNVWIKAHHADLI